MRKVYLILFISLLSFQILKTSGNNFQASGQPTRNVYALSLVHSGNSQPVTFAILTLLNDSVIVKTQIITWDQFILQVSGNAFSSAKKDTINLFLKYGIKGCEPVYDKLTRKWYNLDCPVIYDLWKLRYIRDPFHADERQNNGWAKFRYCPSQAQMKMLSDSFGIKTMSDYFIDDKLFLLLQRVQDPQFVNLYKSQE